MDSIEVIHAKTRQSYNLAAKKYHELFHDELKEKGFDRILLDSYTDRFHQGALICDAGCGPSGHIGRYVFDKGLDVIGIDIADKCVEMAQKHNPTMRFERGDISKLTCADQTYDGIISYYSIIDTPKRYINMIFAEFNRVLKKDGCLLVAVKEGTTEGYVDDLLGIKTELYFSLFTEDEIVGYFEQGGFVLEYIDKRDPYDFEISNTRIFVIGKKA